MSIVSLLTNSRCSAALDCSQALRLQGIKTTRCFSDLKAAQTVLIPFCKLGSFAECRIEHAAKAVQSGNNAQGEY